MTKYVWVKFRFEIPSKCWENCKKIFRVLVCDNTNVCCLPAYYVDTFVMFSRSRGCKNPNK